MVNPSGNVTRKYVWSGGVRSRASTSPMWAPVGQLVEARRELEATLAFDVPLEHRFVGDEPVVVEPRRQRVERVGLEHRERDRHRPARHRAVSDRDTTSPTYPATMIDHDDEHEHHPHDPLDDPGLLAERLDGRHLADLVPLVEHPVRPSPIEIGFLVPR